MDEKTIPLGKLPVDVKVRTAGKNRLGTNLDYRALFEQTGECVFIIGLDFKFITANQQALRLLGYDESQLIGLPVEDIMLLENDDERDALLEKHLSLSESTLRKKDKTLLPVELSISVVHNEAGFP
ncbi:MAG: PAS domain S-box protein, partial [Anaerolineales bacterium]|nr:PAS domain S-box protein [Anaerolineales bacterium]